MKSEDYSQGDAFQAEKRTIFATEWLPICAEAQIAGLGDFLSATVGGWSVIAVRDKAGTLRVLRNACRHQNMPVTTTPSGQCETFRCRFHGWTYGLDGRLVSAPPPVAPADPSSPDVDLVSLSVARAGGLIFFSLRTPSVAPQLGEALPAHGGTIATEIACNWKVCAEHLLGTDVTWHWPLLAVRRDGPVTIVQQIVPHTFLKTRLFTHVFGGAVDAHREEAASIKQICERLQGERAAGTMTSGENALVAEFHRRLDEVYAGSS
jgi:phenylpropionate dioxygenase-like ring-hydroxylating dioxygenase large terminal subunit